MSNIHLYSDEVLYSVRDVLLRVRDNQGQASTKFWQNEARQLQGSWGTDVCNIARQAMGRSGLIFEGKASEAQMAIFVEKAKQQCGDVLREINVLRERQGK